jgi:hypothetical protein
MASYHIFRSFASHFSNGGSFHSDLFQNLYDSPCILFSDSFDFLGVYGRSRSIDSVDEKSHRNCLS